MSAVPRFAAAMLLAWGALSLASLPARGMPFSYPDAVGTTLTFTGISEESITDPTLALFGMPVVVGDGLVFSPSLFSASASGGAVDQRTGALSMTVEALPGEGIHNLELRESGSYTLDGPFMAFAEAQVAGVVLGEVTEIDQLPVVAGLDLLFSIPVIFSGGTGVFTLGASPEVAVPWSGSASIDIDAFIASRGGSGTATRVQWSLANNTLAALSAVGTGAAISKSSLSVNGNVAEPSLLWVASALASVVAVRTGRRRRR